jgi:hypothetical protein
VSDVEVVTSPSGCELRAQVRCDPGVARHPDISAWACGDQPFVLRYEFPRGYESALSPRNGDPFLAALLAPAMVLGEPLQVPVPVSPQLLRATDEVQAIYRCWDRRLCPVSVQAPVRKRRPRRRGAPPRTALFFSLGVDSFYALLKNVADHPGDDQTITDLLVVHGFDVFVDRENYQVFPAVLAASKRVAAALGKAVLPVTTNIREFSDRLVDWPELYHGAALASVALALQSVLSRGHIAASWSYDELFPWGSHPLLDPLWSTEGLSLVHDGCEVDRLDRVRFIAQYPIALSALRVCYENPNNEYNCGRCEKCVRTMIHLHAAGALEQCETFPRTIDLERVRTLLIPSPRYRAFYQRVAELLGTSERDLPLKSAIEHALSRIGA